METFDEFRIESGDEARIKTRIANGVYRINHNKREIGEELWGIFKLKDGGYRLLTEISLQWPVASSQRVRFDLEQDWAARVLWVQLDTPGVRRVATYAPDPQNFGISVYEQPLRNGESRSRNGGNTLTTDSFRIANPPRQIFHDSVGRSIATYLDFGSTLFNFAHLRALRLQLGTAASITTVVPTQPTLLPMQVKQTYTYTRDEQISCAVSGYAAARRYVITEDGDHAPISTLWTDAHDICLRLDIVMGTDSHGCELTQYEWHGL